MKKKKDTGINPEEQNFYKLLFENHPIPLIVFRRDTFKVISANSSAAKFYGYSIDELLNLTILDIRPEEERAKFLEYNKSAEFNNHKAGIWKHQRKNGTVAFVDVTVSDIDFDNIPARVISLVDVTETVKSREALKEEEIKYQTLVESVSEGIVLADNNDVIKFVNKRYCEMLGYTKEELIGKVGYKVLLDEDMQELIKKKNQERIKGITDRYSVRMKKKDGTPIYFEISGTPVYDKTGNVTGSLGIHSDVTDREETLAAIKESEEKFRSLVENSIVGVYLIQDGVFKYLNPRLAEIFGYRIDELLYKMGPEDVTFAEDWLVVKENLRKRINGEVNTLHYTFRGKMKNGKIIYIEVYGARSTYAGKPAVLGTLLDITSRKEAEESLREKEERYRNLFEYAPIGIYQSTVDGTIITANKVFAKILGFDSIEELMSHNISEFYADQRMRESLIKEFKPKGKTASVEIEWKRKGGQKIWIQLDAHILENGTMGEPDFEGFVRDISDKKKAEWVIVAERDRAEEANRLKTAFLSTVSHEIRSPLNAILGFSSILKEAYYSKASDEEKQFFNSMEEAGLRLLDTITQVLDISRLEADDFSLNPKQISVNESIKTAFQVMHIQAKNRNLKFELQLPEEEIIITTDEYCFGGVLVNLISNAIKYSNEGTISVSVSETEDRVICSVKDEGVGMSEEYQKHLFETFSQEDLGLSRRYEGTGLGLAITKRYLDLLGGNIEVQSRKGIGTTIIFSIPKSI